MRANRLLGGISAACLLAVLLVGVPALLVAGLGNPLPAWGALRTGNINDQMVLQLLGCVLWIAWAQWLPGTLLEIVAGLRDAHAQRSGHSRVRPAREPRHISAGQGLSRALVTAIVGLAIATPIVATPIVASAGRAWAAPAPAGNGHMPAVSTASLTNVAPKVATPGQRSSSSGHVDSDGVATHAETRRTTPGTTHPVFVVGSDPKIGPSLWSIAQHTLGDPMRWRDIWALNRDHSMSDGTPFTDPDEICDGWRLRLPADATVPKIASPRPGTEITVRPGDTVDGIAADAHVNPQRLIDVNLGRTEPGGRVFDDPNLILPGWNLRMPGSPGGGAHTAPSHSGDGTPNHQTPSHPRPGETTPTTPATPPSETPPEQPSPTTPTRTPAHASANGHAPASSAEHRSMSELPMVAFVGGGVLLAGVSLTALLGYRRRQFRHRHPGNTISGSPPEMLRAERTLLSTGGPAVLDVTWLDQVLRGLMHGLDDGSDPAALAARLPDVVAVRLARDELELVLGSAQPNAPAPWRVDETGARWSIPRGEDGDYDPARRAYHFAPFPTLASVGYAVEGSQWLLDLERLGSMSLAGDPQRCLDLARFVACELAHNSWSEMLQVTLVGFGEELVAGNPDRLSYTADFDAAIAELHDQVDSVNTAVSEGGQSVLATRTKNSGDSWAPHVLLIAPDAACDQDGLDRLLAAMRQQRARTAVAVVLVNDLDHADATRWTLTVDAGGTLRIPGLSLELNAQQMPADEAAEIAKMLALAATTRDAPMPLAAGGHPWDRFADAAGALRLPADDIDEVGADIAEVAAADDQDSSAPQVASRGLQSDDAADRLAHAADVLAMHFADASSGTNSSVLPLPHDIYVERAATTAEDVAALAPQTSDAIRETVEATLGELDADLTEWYDQESVRPRISLLGPVLVRAQGTLPQRNPRTEWHTEIVAYLVTRPYGVTAEEYGIALWPNDPDIIGKSKVRQSVSIVRKWLGKNPVTDIDYLPTARVPGYASYCIEDALVDAELFRRLRLRGLARGEDGIEDLWAALKLVTGEPFSERRAEGYAWLADNPLHHIYSAMIVDVAHTVATYHLGTGGPERAAEAAQIALDAGSTEDVPLLNKVAACDAQDLAAEADAFVKRILDNHDVDCEEDLPERTFTVLTRTRRHWIGTAS